MGGMFGGGGGGNSVKQQIYAGIQVSTSLLGGCIPYVAGRQRVPFNLLWYGNFQVLTSTSGGAKGGSGNATKQYSYSVAYIAGLCIGPIQGVINIWHDKAITTLTSENLALGEGGASFIGSISGTTLTVTAMKGGFIGSGASIIGPNVLGSTKITALGSGTGGTGTYTVNNSQTVASANLRASQLVWTGYPSGIPAIQQIPYDSVAYVASSAYNLGSGASMPNLSFEVEGVVSGYSDANSIFDADPSAVIQDFLLDPVHGAFAGYTPSTLTIGSSAAPLQGTTNSWQAYVMSVGLLTSPFEDTQRPSSDFTTELLQCTNSDCRLSVGTLEIIPYCDAAVSATVAGTAFSYTPNLTPVYAFTDDDYFPDKGEPPVKLVRKGLADTYNTVSVEYLDRSNYYNQAPVTCSDLKDIATYGPRVASQLSWHQITQASVAKTAGQLWLQRQLYERNTYELEVRSDYSLLEPLDLISLTDSNFGLVGQVCQIMQIEDGADNRVQMTVRELPGVTRSTAQYNWAAAAGYFANQATDPGAVATPQIFVMPPIPASLSEGITLGIAVCGQTSNAAWLGCDVYCSLDGGTTYEYVGTMPQACRYGTLFGGIAAGTTDPDVGNTLQVALANTNLQLSTAVTHAEADSMQTMILVGTGTSAEVLSYGAAALTSAGHYNLTYLHRGVYGSANTSHLSGAPFARLDGAVFQIAMDPGYAGQTVSFKFVSFNTWLQPGPQTLAGATAYTYTIPATSLVGGAVDLIPQGVSVGISAGSDQVYKNGGARSWDSAAYSRQSFNSGCYVRWQPGAGHQMVGITTNPNDTSGGAYAAASFQNFDYAIETDPNGNIWSLVNPTHGGASYSNPLFFSNGLPSDVYEVRYDGNWVHLLRNGTQFAGYQAGQGITFYVKVALEDINTVCSNVEFGSLNASTPLALINSGNAVVIAGNRVVKIGGTSAWDSEVYSANGYLNGCFVSWRAATVSSTFLMVGLSTNPSSVVDYTNFNYATYLNSSLIDVYESGTFVGAFGTYGVGDNFEIRYDGVTIRYFSNGNLFRAIRAPGLKLYAKVALNSPGAAISSFEFGPSSAVNQPTGSWLNTYAWVVGTSGTEGNYVDSGTSTIQLGGFSGVPLGPYGTSEPIWYSHGTGAGQNGGWTNIGDLYGIDTTKTYRSVMWVQWNGVTGGGALFFHGPDSTYTNNIGGTPNANPYYTGSINVAGNFAANKWYLAVGFLHGSSYVGADSQLSGIYDPVTGERVITGSDFVCVANAPYQAQRVYHYNDTNAGSFLFFAKPRFEEVNGNEPSLQSLMAPAAALQGFVTTGQCVVTGQTFAKQGGASAWDSCVYSVKGYTTAHVGGKPNQAGPQAGMIGFSVYPSINSSYTNGNFLWYQGGGTWVIYESGSSITSAGPVALTDLVEITYDGATITYLLNKVAVRTVSVAGLTLYAFVPIDTPGFGWNSVNFGPTTNLAIQDTAQIGSNAVSQMLSVYSAGPFAPTPATPGSPVLDFILSGTITSTGSPVAVDASLGIIQLFTDVGITGWNFKLEVYRDGASTGVCPVATWDSNSFPWTAGQYMNANPTSFVFVDSGVAAGTHTYRIYYSSTCTGTATKRFAFNWGQGLIKLREIKK